MFEASVSQAAVASSFYGMCASFPRPFQGIPRRNVRLCVQSAHTCCTELAVYCSYKRTVVGPSRASPFIAHLFSLSLQLCRELGPEFADVEFECCVLVDDASLYPPEGFLRNQCRLKRITPGTAPPLTSSPPDSRQSLNGVSSHSGAAGGKKTWICEGGRRVADNLRLCMLCIHAVPFLLLYVYRNPGGRVCLLARSAHGSSPLLCRQFFNESPQAA